MKESIDTIQDIVDTFDQSFQSMVIASLTSTDEPYSSYAPFVCVEGRYYLLISKIARHYQNLLYKNVASVLMIEDEQSASNIWFRKRLSFLVKVDIDVKNPLVKETFIKRFGKMAEQLFTMDFIMLECHVQEGNIILGPGKAYHLDKNKKVINRITGNKSKGHGHQ